MVKIIIIWVCHGYVLLHVEWESMKKRGEYINKKKKKCKTKNQWEIRKKNIKWDKFIFHTMCVGVFLSLQPTDLKWVGVCVCVQDGVHENYVSTSRNGRDNNLNPQFFFFSLWKVWDCDIHIKCLFVCVFHAILFVLY